jgi:hypothetical protein
MRRELFLLLFSFLFLSEAFAQLRPVSRARLLTTGGTLQGFVRNEAKVFTPQYFDFSESEGGPFRRLSAGGMLRVELDDSTVFERHRVRMPILARPVEYRQKFDYTASVYFEGDALLEQLLEGDPALYVYTDSFEVAHFFYREGSDSAVHAITYEPYEDIADKGQFGYRNDLERLGLAAGCGEAVYRDVTYVGYETRDMIQFFQQLNACSGTQARIIGRFNKKSNIIRAGLLAGSRYQTHQAILPYDNRGRTGTLGAFAGAWFDFFPRRQNSNLVVGIALGVSLVNESFSPGTKVLKLPYLEMSYKTLQFEVAARRLFGAGKVRPFLEGGLGMDIVTKGSLFYSIEARNGTEQSGTYRFGGSSTEALLGAGLYGSAGSLHLRFGQSLMGYETISSHSLSLMLRVALLR